MTLESRLRRLEANLRKQEVMHAPHVKAEHILHKLGFDMDEIKTAAKATGKSQIAIVAGELGMTYEDLKRALRLKAYGK